MLNAECEMRNGNLTIHKNLPYVAISSWRRPIPRFRIPHSAFVFPVHLAAFWPPAAMITPMMTSPVTTKRMPALTPKVLSMVSKSTRKSPAPHKPTTFALPPLTEVPPITTNEIEVRSYSSPRSSDDPRKYPANSAPQIPPSAPLTTYDAHR